MNRLTAELQRLYFLPGQEPAKTAEGTSTLEFVGTDGMVRAFAVDFARAADWEHAARLYEGVQADFDLPAPAVSVSGKDGYRVWFSLAAPVPREQARGFLEGLQTRYLADIPPAHLTFHPDSHKTDRLELPPAQHGETGKWSAFIDPAMGAMFVEEPGLEISPNLEKQADILAGFDSIKTADFLRVLGLLQQETGPAVSDGQAAGHTQAALNLGGNFSDPKSFLLAVMNDPAANASLRIEAAKALLPYFEKPCA